MNDKFDNFFKLTPEYLEKASEVAGDAFQDDPLTLYSYPNETERKRKLKYGIYMIYKYGMKKGVSYATSQNLEGIIIWLPPNKIYPSSWAMMRHGGFRAMRKTGFNMKAMKRSMKVFKYQESKHRELAPSDHWYLQNIAVQPVEQRKGYGGQLLSAMIEKINLEGLPIYLETNNEKNLSFYQKYGFDILEHGIVPETEVPFWCMLRKPR